MDVWPFTVRVMACERSRSGVAVRRGMIERYLDVECKGSLGSEDHGSSGAESDTDLSGFVVRDSQCFEASGSEQISRDVEGTDLPSGDHNVESSCGKFVLSKCVTGKVLIGLNCRWQYGVWASWTVEGEKTTKDCSWRCEETSLVR